jgi:hypothetical protein
MPPKKELDLTKLITEADAVKVEDYLSDPCANAASWGQHLAIGNELLQDLLAKVDFEIKLKRLAKIQ